MSNKNDTGEIIKEFLDLWQKQFSYMTKDPQTIAAMLKMFQQTQEGYFNNLKKGSDAKPSATADVSGNVDDALRKLSERIASLEARLAELESGAGRAGKATAKPAAGKRPARIGARTAKTAAK